MNHMWKRFLSLFLALVMVFGMIPTTALHAHAAGDGWYWEGTTLYIKDGKITNAQLYAALDEKYDENGQGCFKYSDNSGGPYGIIYGDYGANSWATPSNEVTANATGNADLAEGTWYARAKAVRFNIYAYTNDANKTFTVKHYYDLNATVAAGSPDGAGITLSKNRVNKGESVVITVTAVDGYDSKVKDSKGNEVTNLAAYVPSESTTLTVAYVSKEVTKYNVTLDVKNGEYGTAELLDTQAAAGSTVHIKVEPKTSTASEAYSVVSVKVGDTVLSKDETGNYAYTMGTGDATVVVTFDGKILSGAATANVKYNSKVSATEQMASGAYFSDMAEEKKLEQAIFDALGIGYIPETEGFDWDDVTIEYYPYHNAGISIGDYGFNAGKYPLGAAAPADDTSGNPHTYYDFGERGLDQTEKVRVSYNNLYIEAEIKLVEGRIEAPLTVLTSDAKCMSNTVEGIEQFVAQNLVSIPTANADPKVNYAVGGINPETLTVPVTVEYVEDAYYLGKTVNVTVTLDPSAIPASVTFTVNGNGTVKLGDWVVTAEALNKALAEAEYVLTVTSGDTDGKDGTVTYIKSVKVNGQAIVENGNYEFQTTLNIQGNTTYAIVVEFAEKTLSGATTGAIEFNGFYKSTSELSEAQMNALKEAIFDALGVGYIPETEGFDWDQVTFQYLPWSQGKLGSGNIEGFYEAAITALNADAPKDTWTDALGGNGLRYFDFAERAYNGGAALNSSSEKVRITYGDVYIEAEISLTESRDVVPYTVNAVGEDVKQGAEESTDDLMNRIKAAALAAAGLPADCGAVTYGEVKVDGLNATTDTNIIVPITVASNEKYIGTSFNVTVPAQAKDVPSVITFAKEGTGEGTLALKNGNDLTIENNQVSTFGNDLTLTVTPVGTGVYVDSVSIVDKDGEAVAITESYNGQIYTAAFHVDSNNSYTVTVTYGTNTVGANAEGTIQINRYQAAKGNESSAAEMNGLKTKILEAVGLNANGNYRITCNASLLNMEVIVEILDDQIKIVKAPAGAESYITGDVSQYFAMALVGKDDNTGEYKASRGFTIIKNADGKLPEVSQNVTINLADTRPEANITLAETQYTVDSLDEALTDIQKNLNLGTAAITAGEFPTVEGDKSTLTVTATAAETPDYVKTVKTFQVEITNRQWLSTLTYANGTGYTVAVENVASGDKVESGTYTVTVTPESENGYYISKVTVNGDVIPGNYENYVFTAQFDIENGTTAEIPYEIEVEAVKREVVGLDKTSYNITITDEIEDLDGLKAEIVKQVLDIEGSEFSPADKTAYTVSGVDAVEAGTYEITFTFPGDGAKYPTVSKAFTVVVSDDKTDIALNPMSVTVKDSMDEVSGLVEALILKAYNHLAADDVTVSLPDDAQPVVQGQTEKYQVNVSIQETKTTKAFNGTVEVSVTGYVYDAVVTVSANEGGSAVYNAKTETLTVVPNEGTFATVKVNDEASYEVTAKATSTLANGKGLELGTKPQYEVSVVFAVHGIKIPDAASMLYYIGLPTATIDVLNALVIDALNEGEGGIDYMPDVLKNEDAEIRYLARAKGTVPYHLVIADLGLNSLLEGIATSILGDEIAVDVPVDDMWLSIGDEWVDYPAPSNEQIKDIVMSMYDEYGLTLMDMSRDQLEQLLADTIAKDPDLANYYAFIGAHQFGNNTDNTETVVLTIGDDKTTVTKLEGIISNKSCLTLEDNRKETYIKFNTIEPVTYGITAEELLPMLVGGVYTADGERIGGYELVTCTTENSSLNVGEAVAVEFAYAGDPWDYRDCVGSTTIVINKAIVDVVVDNRMMQYNSAEYKAYIAGNKLPVVTNPAGVDTINFIVGLDVSNVNFEGKKIQGIMGNVQLMLPAELQEMLELLDDYVLEKAGLNISFANGASMKLSDLQSAVDTIAELLPESSEYNVYFETLLNMFKTLPTDVADVKITIGGKIPSDVGVYLVGGVSASDNYETDFGVGVLVITPDGTKAELGWKMEDDNYIITRSLLTSGAFDLSAEVVKMAEGHEDEKAAAEEQIVEIFVGADVDGNLIFENDQTKLNVGAYAELAMIVNWGNEMYYSEPILRAFIVMAETLDVNFVDENGNVNNERIYTFNNKSQEGMEKVIATYKHDAPDGSYKAGDVVEGGNVKYFYVGAKTNVEPYASTTAPTNAGAYAITAIYTLRDGDNMITHVGISVGALVIEPAASETTVTNNAIRYDGNAHGVEDMITVKSAVDGITPDKTVITAGLTTEGGITVKGLDSLVGIVNVDVPQWLDDLLIKYDLLAAAYTDEGIDASVFKGYIDKIYNFLSEQGIEPSVMDGVVDAVNQLPDNVKITMHSNVTFDSVGAYMVLAVVTDSDHYPSAGIGVLIIYPDYTEVDLKFEKDLNDNNIFTWAALQNINLDASAYDKDTDVLNAEATKLVTNIYAGIDDDGDIHLTTDKSTLDNGAYAQVAYLLDIGSEMYVAKPISRAFLIVPNPVTITFVDENGNENDERHFVFDNTAHGMTAVASSDNPAVTVDQANLSITYTGVQTNGEPYNSSDAPIRSGAYVATAVYTARDDQNRLVTLGVELGALVIEPAASETTVTNNFVKYDGQGHGTTDMVTTKSTTSDAVVHKTVITAGITTDKDFTENGLNAITGTVNVDLSEWMDKVLKKLDVLQAGYTEEGIPASQFIGYAQKIYNKFNELGLDTSSLDEVMDLIKQLPEQIVLTFHDNKAYTNVGAYLVIGIATDSDHYPSMGVGLMVIYPDVTTVDLKFAEDWNGNNIFTWAALQNLNLDALAYDQDTGAFNAEATEHVTNLYLGISDQDGIILTKDKAKLSNGAYTQFAFLLDLGSEMYYAEPISRAFLIVPNPVTINFIDGNGKVNNDQKFVFDNQAHEMKVSVTAGTPEVEIDMNKLNLVYSGIQTNGQVYRSTNAPTHSGAYVVTATYVAKDEQGRLVTLGAQIGAMAIEPAKSSVEIESKIHAYDGKGVNTAEMVKPFSPAGVTPNTTVITAALATDGSFTENGLKAIQGGVNVDFPAWIDEILLTYVPGVYNDMTASEFAQKATTKLTAVVETLNSKAAEQGMNTNAMANMLIKAIEGVQAVAAQLPADTMLSFHEQADVMPSAVGSYLVIGVVTDSNHLPSVGAGVLVIHPAVEEAKLHWVYEDSNNIFTLPALEWLDMSAYAELKGEDNTEITGRIQYLTVGVDAFGKVVITTQPNGIEKNGTYTEVAYVPFQADSTVIVAAPILRNFVVVPNTADVTVTDTTATYGEAYDIPVSVIDGNGTQVTGDRMANATYTYIGLNRMYHSTDKPTNVGTYAVIVRYLEQNASGATKYIGYGTGKLTIVPAEPEYVLSDNDTVCGDVNSIADMVTNTDSLPYQIFVARNTAEGDVYVILPAAFDVTLKVYENVDALISVLEALPAFIENTKAVQTVKSLLESIDTHTITVTDAELTKEGTYDVYAVAFGDINYLPATAHAVLTIEHIPADKVVENNVDPTCTEGGSYDEVVYCSVCEEELSRNTVTVPATGHTEDEPVVENEVKVTCMTNGTYDSVVYCSVCKEELSRENVIVQAQGHHCRTETVEPTCTEKGYNLQTCLICGEVFKTSFVDALGHTEGDTVIENKKDATCTEDGSYDEVVYCSVCDAELSRNTTTVPATGHTEGDAVVENKKDATCTEDGSYDLVVYCSVCNAELSRNTTTVPATGHTQGDAVIENKKDATCTEDGSYDEVVYCSVCDAELSRNTTTVPATGHTEGTAVKENEVKATCKNPGSYDLVVYCSVCDAELSREPGTLEQLPHTAGEAQIENKVEASCTQAGSYDLVTYCDDCGSELSRTPNEIPMIPHADIDGDGDHSCDECEKENITKCVDADQNNLCDECGEPICTHVDEDPADHFCDICDRRASDCIDEDEDNTCDICGEKMHICTGGEANCQQGAICDICGEEYTEPLPTNHVEKAKWIVTETTHKFAYPCCDEVLIEEDDHNWNNGMCPTCDYTCEHKDEADDGDHDCDICDKEDVTDCSDKTGDSDHSCDDCGAENITDCTDTNHDGLCDECGKNICSHADENPKDHNCDICGNKLSDCSDKAGDSDHKCDTCGKEGLTNCTDENKDNICDECGKTMCDHKDENADHKCDTCGNELSKCTDANKDHKCDVCGTELSKCADEDKDHKCDLCDKVLSECVDEDEDYKCDICDKELDKPESGIVRIFGNDRFYTALKIADEMKAELGVSKFNTIIIASGKTFPDALAGSYLANAKNAPILLAYKHDQNVLTTDYVKANLAEGGKVYILGGTAAVPTEVEELLSGYNITRLGGKDRFETNLMILREVGVRAGQEIMVCTATNFPDSLSASATGNPILLVWNEKKELRKEQKEFLNTLSGNTFTVVGGTSAVCEKLEKDMAAYGATKRLAGADRFVTSVKIAEAYFGNADEAVLAYAKNFPDALCGGPLAFVKGAPLILSMNQFAENATGFISGKIHKGAVLGGSGLISDASTRVTFGMEEGEQIIVR